jgi:uncharacterized membrane protein
MNAPTRRLTSRSWLAGILIVSLALNAFLLGAIATDYLRLKHWSGGREARGMRYELRWLEGRLSPEAMRQVEQAVTAAKPKTVAHIDRLRALRSELAVLAAVPAPDRVAIDAKLAEIRAEVASMQTEVQATTMNALLALPAEARAPLAQPEARR